MTIEEDETNERPSRFRGLRHWETQVPSPFCERDVKENDESRLATGERVEMVGVWVVELYTPSTVRGLAAGLKRLGWDPLRRFDDQTVDDVLGAYRSGARGGWTRLDFVGPSSGSGLPGERRAELPAGVVGCQPLIIHVTPSITALLAYFVFSEEAARALSEVLACDYETYRTAIPPVSPLRFRLRCLFTPKKVEFMGARIHSPEFQRRDRAVEVRRELRERCTWWVRERFPGAFAGDVGRGWLPTSELLVTEQHRPLTPEGRETPGFRAAALDFDFRAWRSDEWPAVRMLEGYRMSDHVEDRGALVLAAKRGDAVAASGYHDPTSNRSLVSYSDNFIRGLTLRWSLDHLLYMFHERLGEIRDVVSQRGLRGGVRRIRETRRMLVSLALDAQLAADEIGAFCKDEWSYRYDVMEMVEAQPPQGSEPEDLLTEMWEGQQLAADQLSLRLRLVTDVVSSAANMSAAIANIRLQRFVLAGTFLAVVVAILTYLASQS